MLIPILLASALAAGPATSTTPSTTPLPSAAIGDHGKLPWFTGTFDELVREAAKSKKIIFIDFWTTWCGWCKRLDADTFSNDAVVTEMKDVLCYSVDAESDAGAPIAKRFGATSFPTLVFLDPDGTQRDRISGYLPPKGFIKEVQRIKRGEGTFTSLYKKVAADPKDPIARLELAQKLRQSRDEAGAQRELAAANAVIARSEGFDPNSIADRWRIAEKLRQLSDSKGFQAQVAAIRALDPDEKSAVLRRLKLENLVEAVSARYQQTQTIDTADVIAFLTTETEPELLFQGWNVVHNIQRFQAEEARKRENTEAENTALASARQSGRNAWPHCPPELVADWGKYLADTYYQDAELLTTEEKAFAIEVAEKALLAAPDSGAHHEMLACCLFVAGKRDEALAKLERGIELDPTNDELKERLVEFKKLQ